MKHRLLNGIDSAASVLPTLVGKRIGLITNPTGVTREFVSTADVLHSAGALHCLFAPEHGIRGDVQAGEKVANTTDARTGATVYSLYGKTAPWSEVLPLLDAVAYDIQDVGARFYTYIYTLLDAMRAAAEYDKEVIVFDRPNPLGGRVEGAILQSGFESGVGKCRIPTRYGLTPGEFAEYINEKEKINCRLTVVPLVGYDRSRFYDDGDLAWISPSPNLPTLDSCFCYVGTCLAEGTNLSEGRGTTRPFELLGAPWLDNEAIAREMNARQYGGVRLRPCFFTPTFSKYHGELCRGLQLHVYDRHEFSPFEYGVRLFDLIRKTHDEFEFRAPDDKGRSFFDLLLGSDEFRQKDFDAEDYLARARRDSDNFARETGKYLLYP